MPFSAVRAYIKDSPDTVIPEAGPDAPRPDLGIDAPAPDLPGVH